MKLKKLSAALLVATLTTGLVAGCGSSSSDTNEGNQVETPATESADASASTATTDGTIEPCEIEFWHAMTGQQEETLTEMTEKFNSENEYGITVTLVNQGYYSDLSTKLTANAVADTLPDMAQAYNSWVLPYIDKVVHLDDFVANDYDDYDDIIESYRAENSEFGFISGMPFNKSTYVLFYNKTLFDELGLEAPTTWEDMYTVGEAFKTQKDMVAFGYDDLAGMLEATIRQAGSEYVTADGAQFDNEQGQAALTQIMGLYENGYARLVGEDGYFSGPFSNQLVAAYVGSSTGVSYITHDDFELGVAPLPGDAVKAANQAGTNLFMFTQDANKQKAVWEYMKYLTSTEATTEWAMATGYLPIRTSAYESDEYQTFMQDDPTSTAAYAQSDSFFYSPAFDGSYDVMSAMNTKMEELILNNTDAETALTELVDTVNNTLK